MDRPLRVLIVADSVDDTELLLRQLRGGGYQPVFARVDNPAALRAALDEPGWEVVIADDLLPDVSAPAALALLKDRELDLPLIIVTDRVGEDAAVAAMKEGAADYLLKDRLARLGPAVAQALEQKRLRDEKRQDELALRESERKLRLIAENTTDVVLAYDMNRRLIYVNPAVERQTGYGVEELHERDFINWLHPEDEAKMARRREQIYQGIGFSNEEFRIVTKQGEVKWVLASWGPLSDESGRQIGVQGREQDITERKLMEEALRQSEASLGRAQEIAHLGNWDQNLVTGELSWSDEIYRIFGFAPQELAPTADFFFRCVHPDDVELVRQAVEAAWRQRRPYHIDHRIVRPDGSERIVHEQAEISFDELGNPVRMIGTVQDITERKRAEEALHESEERFRTTFTYAVTGMAQAGLGGRFLQVNPSLCEMLGYSEQELLSLHFQDITHPDDLASSLELVRQLLAGQTDSFQMEKRYLHKDGHVVWGQLSVSLVRDARGRPLQSVVEIQDITERKRVEEELRKSEERYRDLFENANDILYTHDLRGNFTSINKAGERLCGYPRDETLKLNIAQIVAPECLSQVRENLADKLSSGLEATTYELEVICKDGSRLPVEVHTRLIYEAGRPVGVQGIARDISERKQAEAEHHRLEEQLFQAQKMESIGTLAGGVAHDFNNLLTAILGNTQLALARLKPEDLLHRRLLEIAKAANRASSLTSQLLAFSRRQRLERKHIDLNDTLGDFMKMLRRIIGADVELSLQVAPNLSSVFADPTQIEQVVMNLAVNARDAMPGGGRISIETHSVRLDEAFCHEHPWAKPGSYVQLAVSDTGCGMDAETRQRIFEPFFTTKEVGKGTGLGLAVVYGIIQQHDGLIHVQSAEGRGTTFKIYLPATKQAATAEPLEAQPALRGGRETILVVEDEESLRELIQEVLGGLGYNVLLARDGKEAVELYAAHHEQVALAVLDLVMPRMGGQEAYERMRERGGKLPVIFMTGYSVEVARSQFLTEAGATLMQKPYSMNELGRKVREALDQSTEPVAASPELRVAR